MFDLIHQPSSCWPRPHIVCMVCVGVNARCHVCTRCALKPPVRRDRARAFLSSKETGNRKNGRGSAVMLLPSKRFGIYFGTKPAFLTTPGRVAGIVDNPSFRVCCFYQFCRHTQAGARTLAVYVARAQVTETGRHTATRRVRKQ